MVCECSGSSYAFNTDPARDLGKGEGLTGGSPRVPVESPVGSPGSLTVTQGHPGRTPMARQLQPSQHQRGVEAAADEARAGRAGDLPCGGTGDRDGDEGQGLGQG